jgi:hypothetical protein
MIKFFQLVTVAVLFGMGQIVSAAGGWYLLLPTTSDYDNHSEYLHEYKILDMKPLNQWSQEGSYDSVSECEAVKNSLLSVEQNFYSKINADYIKSVGSKEEAAVLEFKRYTAARANANVNIWRASRCVKSDDPRLTK